jgi:hypothetical protein
MNDPINPQHYKHLPVEAIDIIEAAIAKAPSNKAAGLHWQALKYLLRCWEKNGVEDLRKGKVYLDRMVTSFDDLLAEASGANETPSDEPSKSAIACDGESQKPNREEFLNEIDGVWIDGSSNDTDQDDHPHDFKVGDAVISWRGREGIIEAIGLIDDFPITVRHSIREQVSYKIGGVKKRHDDHPVETEPWKPKIGERVIYTPSGSLWTVDRELKEKPRDGVTYILKDGTFTLRACLSRLAPIEPPKRYRDPTQADLRDGPIECEYRNSKSEHWQSGLLVHILDSVHPFLCVSKAEQLSNQWRQCRIQCRIEVK